MPSIDPKLNIGSKAIQTIKDETIIPNIDVASAGQGFIDGAVAGVEGFVSDIGVDISSALTQVTDFSLTKGINIDGLFDIGGQLTNPFGNLKLSIPKDLQGFLGNKFSLDDVVDQFGIGGLFGNLPISVNTDVAPKLDPTPNVLHNYASFTYRITMGAQDIKDHQEIASEGFTRGTPKITTMMMASGGGHDVDGVTRDPIFEEDFYLEDLKMTTVIGSSAKGNGSNTVGITFNVFEPYAVSFIERLLALAEKLGYENYIEIPYIFKIDFIGYNDAGEMIGIIPQTTKYIPFRLTYMKFEVKGKGSLYRCTGIPTNHFTFNQTVEALSEGVEISAGTIADWFNGKATGDQGSNATDGLVETVNGYLTRLTEKSRGSPSRNAADRIKIVIDKEISKHRLVVGNLGKVAMFKEGFQGNAFMDPTKPTYGFLKGTAITAIIRSMIKNSTFWTSQLEKRDEIDEINATLLVGEKARAKAKPPLIDIKITSTYKMLEYDPKANRHAYEATYIVQPHETAGQQNVNIGRSEIENIAKEYDYLFTGKNQDILDLEINFNLAFFNSAVSNTEDSAEGSPTGGTKLVNGADTGDGTPQSGDAINKTEIHYAPPASIENIGTASAQDIQKLKASALEKSIMQSSAGDMITLDLTIMGDPSFIKQDDILYRTDDDKSNPLTDNGSIKQDNGDMYLRLRFKTFDDIDHETGLRVENRQIPNSTFTRKSTFDGFYRIMMLDNVFEKGRFTQNLVVVRTYTQETDEPTSDSATNLISNLVSFPLNIKDQLIDDATNSIAGAVNAATLTASQQVEEAKKLAGDFAAGLVPAGAKEFEQKAENLISSVFPLPNVESIVALTTATRINPALSTRQGTR